ncbi:hypothetical protein [Shewanella woodyi]|uniref:hypothetical protein n=1 Tax=Shewanella woodyi TaxID=60961 RepID=UPI003747A71A
MELAKYAMGLNGDHKAEEQMIYHSFVQECDLAGYQLSKQDNIDSVIKIFAKSKGKSKRIILLELFGILLADGEICKEESDFMEPFIESLGVEHYEAKKIQRWVTGMNDMVSEGYLMINKE